LYELGHTPAHHPHHNIACNNIGSCGRRLWPTSR
jgi:hypothetical protein